MRIQKFQFGIYVPRAFRPRAVKAKPVRPTGIQCPGPMDFGSEGTSAVGSQMIFRTAMIVLLILCAFCAPASVFSRLNFSSFYFAQTEKPEWCRNLPRPEYKSL